MCTYYHPRLVLPPSNNMFEKIPSDLIYPDYFVSPNNVSLARYLVNQNQKYKEQNYFQCNY